MNDNDEAMNDATTRTIDRSSATSSSKRGSNLVLGAIMVGVVALFVVKESISEILKLSSSYNLK